MASPTMKSNYTCLVIKITTCPWKRYFNLLKQKRPANDLLGVSYKHRALMLLAASTIVPSRVTTARMPQPRSGRANAWPTAQNVNIVVEPINLRQFSAARANQKPSIPIPRSVALVKQKAPSLMPSARQLASAKIARDMPSC